MSSMLHRPEALRPFCPSSRFWRTVSDGKMSRFSGTSPRPSRAIMKALRPISSRPLNMTEPLAATCPMMALMVVERPTPLRPSRLTISPFCTFRCTPCRMWLLP